jgi:SAM-dependent methyltransferase
MKSYVAKRLGVLGRINEALNLHLSHTRRVRENVLGLLEQSHAADMKIKSLLGVPVSGLKMLEIGPGQQLVQLAYFAMRNEVIGIDLDVILQNLNLGGSMRMIRKNGWLRTFKTVGRKMALIDHNMRTELASQLGLRNIPVLRVLQMDAARMDFPSDQFDVVFSRAVFEHLPDPGAVISEMHRVLKPGGVMFIVLHLFTSDSGCHDARIFAGKRGELPFWAHLRPEHQHAVRSNSYLNKLRLADWRNMFQSRMPGSEVVALRDAQDLERQKFQELRSLGQLDAYSDEELLSVTVEVIWRKPLQRPAAA